MVLPDRFQEEDEDEVDGAENKEGGVGFVQQSVYGMIAAAGQSNGQLPQRFQPDSGSDSEADGETDGSGKQGKTGALVVKDTTRKSSDVEPASSNTKAEGKAHRKGTPSESKLLRNFLKPIRERSDSQASDSMSQSQFLPPRETSDDAPERAVTTDIRSDVPMMDRKLHAKARAEMDSSVTSTASGKRTASMFGEGLPATKFHADLPATVAGIFQFSEPEEIISEYQCWYLQSVLLKGYLYITKHHICFYAYLQKKGNVVVKSGHLGKQGKRNPRYRRYWFILKGDVFSYFTSAANPYFPNGTIDLRYGISAELAPEKGKDKDHDVTTFTVTTEKRTFYFKADSATSAREWVKQLQKVIFRTRNDGDSVKISLPIANIVDVESQPAINFAETIKIRVIDNDDSYAVDEYYFTFFTHGKDALNMLRILTGDNEAKRAAAAAGAGVFTQQLQQRKPAPHGRLAAKQSPARLSMSTALAIPEPVRSTLSPLVAGSPRISSERGRSSGEHSRASLDRGRASFDRGRSAVSSNSRSSFDQHRRISKSPLSPSAHESSESFVTTSEHPSSPATPGGGGQIDMSASVMLAGDAAFRAPTLRMPQPQRTVSGSTVERLRRESQQSSPSPSSPEEDQIRVQPPSRTLTEQALPSLGRASLELRDEQKVQSSTSTIGSKPMRVLATPLQHAFTFAGHVHNQSKRGLSYLSSSPKDYYNKFSGAIAGGKRHYADADGLDPDDHIDDAEDELDTAEHERRFQKHFALPESERLVAVFYCWLHRVLPLYGKIYVGTRRFCFRSLLYGTRTKMVVPFRNIDNLQKEKGFRWGYPGMVVVIRGHEELFFDFGSNGLRDDCVVTVLRELETARAIEESFMLTADEQHDADTAAAEHKLLQLARKDLHAEDESVGPRDLGAFDNDSPPILFDDPNASVLDFKPKSSMNITCLTIGSRGDIQPFIALCKGFLADGHKPRIATHREFQGWVEKHGIEFEPVEGDPAELMRVCVDNGMFTPSFLYEANSKFRGWLDTLLESAYVACKGSDLLIESPAAMCGIHIAEALSIPYFRAFTMPWTRTRAYPHAFAVPGHKMGGTYNWMSYTLFDNVFWAATASQINRWRRKVLGLKPTSLEKLQQNKVPFLYNFSPSVVVPPLDFSDWVRVTGYWFLDEGTKYTPPDDLMAFINDARKDGMKLVYIGFGSVTVNDSKLLTQQIVDAVLKADVRCILSKGWSDRFDTKAATTPEVVLPPSVLQIRAAPHDWLFKHIDAAVHHGGAGTTGASLRAGLPTIIKPFFGDQFFFATRVEDLGVGQHLKKITVNGLGKALWIATHDERMRTKARVLGEQIRKEEGGGTAINAIYRDLEYARTLIKQTGGIDYGKEEEDTEESWTFVEDESDVDVTGSRSSGHRSWAPPDADMGVRRQSEKRLSLGSMVIKGRT